MQTKKLISIVLSAISLLKISAASEAQESADSVSIQNLEEIVIEAPKVIHKADMDVYHPSRSSVDNSKNGIQLLQNLMIPSLNVSDALGTVSAAGESVQVRINGRQATVEQIKSLLPETIRRVEWLTNPGLRYNGANYVLNFIVSNPSLGGSLMLNAQQAVNVAWGDYMVSSKFNSGRSQWEIGGHFRLTDHMRATREYHETFTRPDEYSLTRTERPIGGHISGNNGNAWISYNYIKPDTTVFYLSLSANREFSNESQYKGLLSMSDGSDDILLNDGHGSNGTTPSVSAYLEQHFAKRQTLVVDFGSSLYMGKSFSDYLERLQDTKAYLTDIHTSIKDRNQAYAIEADYIKNWNDSRLTVGASYNANRNRSEYENLSDDVFHQKQDRVYIFAEYFRKYRRFTFTAGLGTQYTDFRFRETDEGNATWSLRPKATVTYALNQNHQFRLGFTSWQSAPSLTETNIAPLQIDGFQWRIGNPNLKTSTSYMLMLTYNFGLRDRIYGVFGIRAFTSPDAITPLIEWRDERLVTTYENSRGLQNLSFFLAPQIHIIPDWLTASGYLQFRAERMRGTGYDLHNSAWSGDFTIQLMHWGFVLTGRYQRAQRDLWGEKISWGEDMNQIDLSYNYCRCQFRAGIIMPFGRYDRGSELLSKWNTNEQHTRLDMRVLYLSVSYNLQWGRQKRRADKLVNIDANADRSNTSGR